MTTAPRKTHRYANAASLQIAAVINGLYRFDSQEKAEHKLASFRRSFTISREQEENPESPSLILWLRNFELTPEEEAQGFYGHFAILRIEEMEDGLFTITATKLPTELRYHPLRRRPATRTPNWGHPILRSIKKGKQYGTLDEAQDDLERLHLEYPETTIPAQNKLFLMIFSRAEDAKNPLKKYVLEIKHLQGGGFEISWALNQYKPSVKAPTSDFQDMIPPQGHFSSMVALKRRKKK